MKEREISKSYYLYLIKMVLQNRCIHKKIDEVAIMV